MVTGGTGKLPIHGGNEVFLGALEHAEVGFCQWQEGGRHILDVLVLLHILWWVLGGDIRGRNWGCRSDLFLPLFAGVGLLDGEAGSWPHMSRESLTQEQLIEGKVHGPSYPHSRLEGGHTYYPHCSDKLRL